MELSIDTTTTTVLDNNNVGGGAQQRAAIRFSVTDQGRGLSKEEIEKVFLPFQRLHAASKESGTGLGLTIVSKLVEALGGEIGVESDQGKGSTFSFTLPLFDDSSSPSNIDEVSCTSMDQSSSLLSELTPVGSSHDDSSIEALRVLIADDNVVNRKVAKRSLERLGVKGCIDLAHDGKEAVDMTIAKGYDLVLMDLQMPIMDGLEATRIITSRQSHPVIIFLTAHAGPEFEVKTRQAGGVGHITKPFKLEQIKSVLAETAHSHNWSSSSISH